MSFKFDFCIDPDIETDNGGFLSGSGTSVGCTSDVRKEQNELSNNDVSDCDGDQGTLAVDTARTYSELRQLANSERIRDCRKEQLAVANSQHLTYLATADVEQELKQDDDQTSAIKLAISTHSDLVPSVYEGGLQVWECCFDLVDYLSQQSVDLSQLYVLEIGCGSGLPGCYALSKGAVVDFQDFNADVITSITIPNAALNLPSTSSPDGVLHFYSGDWSDLAQLFSRKDLETRRLKYDMILTSETIYNQQSYDKLHDLIQAALKPSGIVYIAAKTYYFGVGGGTRDFESFVSSRAAFNCRSVLTRADRGVQREILQMSFNDLKQ